MLNSIRFGVLVLLKILSKLFFRVSAIWVGAKPPNNYRDIRLGILLNHTSLFEPIFLSVLPLRVLWEIATRGIIAGADVTLNRPFAGGFYKLLAPKVITITRKRDDTWRGFLSSIRNDSLILIAPEGRMKRPTGFDKDGKPMTVRGGVADLLQLSSEGKIFILYSGGLHHIHAPGQFSPNLFKRARAVFEVLDISAYKQSLGSLSDEKAFKLAVIKDLERRRDQYCSDLPAVSRGSTVC